MADERMRIVSKEGNPFGYLRVIMEDTKTGVEYLYVQSGYSGGLTVLVDRDGKPLIRGGSAGRDV